MVSTRALVTYGPDNASAPLFKMENLEVDEAGEYELLVQMVATGICHSDIHIAARADNCPKILGHEGTSLTPTSKIHPELISLIYKGAGRVLRVGSKVTKVSPGDPVLLSFHACEECTNCRAGHPALCPHANKHRAVEHPRFLNKSTGERINGLWFGQSSFASIALVREASCIPARTLLKDPMSDEELKLFAPLGCGFMTGAGAVINVAKPGAGDEIMISGLGGVGLGALMAAKIAGCKRILAVDRVEERLELAKELGATHTFNTCACKNLDTELRDFATAASTEGFGFNIAIDTTGYLPLVSASIETLAPGGQVLMVGLPQSPTDLAVKPIQLLVKALSIRGVILGDAAPKEFVPKMVEWYREGRFPIDKLIRFYKAEDVGAAIEGMRDGRVVKPVLLW
jgi:Zn-dependent alcohol dehydrogenase